MNKEQVKEIVDEGHCTQCGRPFGVSNFVYTNDDGTETFCSSECYEQYQKDQE